MWFSERLFLAPAWTLADDGDDEIVPPFDPGTGFEGILPNPPVPAYLTVGRTTSPYGVRQVFNTPETVMGQSFTPAQPALDWVAFVFQNHTQPGTLPGPAALRAKIYTDLDRRNGVLSGLLAESETLSIPADTTAWLIFSFARTVPVAPGTTYYCRLELVQGYPSWAGGRLQDFHPGGSAFGYLPNPFGGPVQDLGWERYDLVFACGTGRGATGVSPGALIEWGLPYGLKDYDELGDPDDDGHHTFVEYLRGTNPIGRGGSPASRAHFIEIAGARHFAWTVATPSRLDYLPGARGALHGATEGATDVFAPAFSATASDPSGLHLLEVSPPVAEGLPPPSPFYRYRTFRLSQPVASAPQGFILNQIRLAAD